MRRYTHFDERFVNIAYNMALLGATDAQVAKVCEVDVQTIDYWKRTYTGFALALKVGKQEADAQVANSFFKCCNGYTYTEEHIHIAKDGTVVKTPVTKYKGPDAWSCAKWLAIRQRATWSETHRVDIQQTRNINVSLNINNLTTEELLLAKKLGLPQMLDEHNPTDTSPE